MIDKQREDPTDELDDGSDAEQMDGGEFQMEQGESAKRAPGSVIQGNGDRAPE